MSSASTKTIAEGRRVAILGVVALFVLSAFIIMPQSDESDAAVSTDAYFYIESSEAYEQGITKYLDYDGEHSIEVRLDLDGVTEGDSTTTLKRTIEYRMLDTVFVGCDFYQYDVLYFDDGTSYDANGFTYSNIRNYSSWHSNNTLSNSAVSFIEETPKLVAFETHAKIMWNDQQDSDNEVVFRVDFDIYEGYRYETTVTFNANGGTGAPSELFRTDTKDSASTETVSLGVPSKEPTRDGYDFVGWSTSAGGPVEFEPGEAITTQIGNEITLYAQWEEQAATVTFMSNDSVYTTVSVPIGQTVSMPDDPTLYGYTFKGWFTDNTFVTEFDPSTLITGDMTLYAKWEGNLEFTTDPIADGTVTPVSGSPGTVLFSATGSQDYTSLVWDFGDGKTSTNTYVTHYYSEPGTYTASLTVYNNYGEDTTYFTIEVPDSTTGGGTVTSCFGLPSGSSQSSQEVWSSLGSCDLVFSTQGAVA